MPTLADAEVHPWYVARRGRQPARIKKKDVPRKDGEAGLGVGSGRLQDGGRPCARDLIAPGDGGPRYLITSEATAARGNLSCERRDARGKSSRQGEGGLSSRAKGRGNFHRARGNSAGDARGRDAESSTHAEG